MKILSVELKNFKIHKDFKFDFNGKSAMIIGDSEVGKSTLIKFIWQYLGLQDFDTDSLTEGETSGAGVLKVEVGGQEYVITRPLSADKKTRFKITSKSGSFDSLDSFYNAVMGGIFTTRYFDYNRYFFKEKSAAGRVKYFAEIIGDSRIQKNKDKIQEIKSARTAIGTSRKTQEFIKNQAGFSDYTPEKLEADRIYYKKSRELSEAKEVKEVFLETNLIKVDSLTKEKESVADDVLKLNALNEQLSSNLTKIEELELQLAQLKENNVLTQGAIDQIDPNCIDNLKDIESKLSTADEKNQEFRTKADELYEKEVAKITEFNEKRSNFIRGVMSVQEFKKLDKQYQVHTEEMAQLERDNKKIFQDNIPVKEITYHVSEEGDEMIMYKGRELTFDNVSGGESIRIATKIQRALNPDKSNFILIQNAGLLGSSIDEVLKEAKKFKTQVILEVTERDEPLQIEFVEDNPTTILTKKTRAKSVKTK